MCVCTALKHRLLPVRLEAVSFFVSVNDTFTSPTSESVS